MPTQQVEPGADESLQDVANALLKARKVVVVTGAGISTNSGIPDFRSENGLYSLIQAQFDAASRANPQQEASPSQSDDDDEPSPKRRRITRYSSIEIPQDTDEGEKDDVEDDTDSITVCPLIDPAQQDASYHKDSVACLPPLEHANLSTPRRLRSDVLHAIPTSPLSSPPAGAVPPSVFRNANARYYDAAFSSSPLSSPPPILFDPWASSPPASDTSPSRRSSTTPSEMDDTCSSNPLSSQSSNTALSSLPNMKGKDLFDASIWADPLRTSVFYTFATSLKQKIKDCEPTDSHHFISHLRDRGKLVRCYTQNIDRIEEKVGLSTSLEDGPGARGRFSRKSTNASQLAKMVEESKETTGSQDTDGTESPTVGDETIEEEETRIKKPPQLERSKSSGVECVFLHGSLESLRCFLCGRISSWDDNLEGATLSGRQPECPHCIGATVAREERGKRALGVGKLRPDIVLYGEEHPNAHLISPIVTHDLGLCPDVLLILGTSLRVHGLKIMVREFAKSIHNRGGKVIFVNFTKPPESIWGDIIDYWVQWDCDAWVSDLRVRIPKLWEDPPPPKKKKTEEEKEKEKREKPPPANPVALRDTRVTGAYWTLKIRDELFRITGNPSLALKIYEPTPERPKVGGSKRNSLPANRSVLESSPSMEAVAVQTQVVVSEEEASSTGKVETTVKATKKLTVAQRATGTKARRSRKSAPGALERPAKKQPSSTLNPAHGRSTRGQPAVPTATFVAVSETKVPLPLVPTRDARTSISSILNSVKENPRVRKRKKLDGEEVVLPSTRRRANTEMPRSNGPDLTLAPLTNMQPPTPPQLDPRPRPLEPESPPTGPILRFSSFSSGISSAFRKGQQAAVQLQDFLNRQYAWGGPRPQSPYPQQPQQQQQPFMAPIQPAQAPFRAEERDVARFMADMKTHNDFVNMR